MCEAITLSEACGQTFTIHITDLQLYKIVLENTWVARNKFQNFYPLPGIMHLKTNFVGCIGSLMANTCISEVLKSAFGSVDRMLIGKLYPQNTRALRLLVEELLRSHMANINSYEDLMHFLDDISKRSKTCKTWVENLVRPVLLLLKLQRAERESDWPFQLICDEMLP